MMGKNFENPFGKTTAKGTIIKMSSILDSGVFPGMQGGPLEHVIAAKAIAFHECLQPEFKEYGRQVIKNAQVMANAFVARGYNIISGGTENHLMLIDLRNKNVTGKQVQETLELADITLNKNAVPFDTQSPMITSGIRVGSPAITTRGFKEDDCLQVVKWIDMIIENIDNESVISTVREDINAHMEHFPLYAELTVA
jgi:glycine hydroxymethyltransferase